MQKSKISDTQTTTVYIILNETRHEKTCLMPYANNKGTDQPAHLRSLISAFVLRCLDSIILVLAKAEQTEQAGLSLTWSHTSEDRFTRVEAKI